MSGTRRGLGRGLGALIPATQPAAGGAPAEAVPVAAVPVVPTDRGTVAAKAAAESLRELAGDQRRSVLEAALAPVDGARFAELPLESISPNPRQPREVFDEEKLAELVSSIKEVGLLQPVVVRQTGPERYELIMGERRWRASRLAGLDAIPAIVRATDDDKLLLDALLENLHRAELNALEEAAAYDQLLRDFGCTHDELADRVGKSRPHVSNTLRLMKLPVSVQLKVAAGEVTAGHAKAILMVPDAERQEKLATRVVAEHLTVRATEEIAKLLAGIEPKKRAPRAEPLPTPAFDELAGRLSDRFETRVKVEVAQNGGKFGRGKVVLEFGSVEDLNRILDSLAPGERGLPLA
ncbi:MULTISPECIES: ParB/RepB/Spo0J family partition protein [Kitasatospora]|uniref:ParB/RepB/Spo0J family partition protein n=1 Tax=Kitasatospora TaxID=2063 RepID=UPI0022852E0E|nr:ParB/RepB/Spo0J family partition protein [Kitasatospora sp. YST-16]WAL72893.1 ParB/RepB/Spo0J family partition protein [Kitasatospora sp. YST-16]WNW38943.1 ParB/RepB/Spo0J family partition protein [Streptomyces sp. Li-HN-5-13]